MSSLTQFQHYVFPSLDLDMEFIDLLKLPGLLPLSLCLPHLSIVNALPDVSPVLFFHISLLRITPTTSSNLRVFELGMELLTTMTKPFQLSGNEHGIKRP